ncbi:RNA polymerase sigma factor [Niabella terrae]
MTVIHSYYTSYRAKLIALACHFGYNKEEAEDIVQQFFLELLQKDIRSDIQNPEAYLVTAFKRKLIDLYRAGNRNSGYPLPEMPKILSTQEILEGLETDKALIEKLADAYKTLPARCRRVIYMKYYHGYSTPQIVKLTGLSQQNVYNNLSKGIQLLRKSLGKQAGAARLGQLLLSLFW